MDFHHTVVLLTVYFAAAILAVALTKKLGLGAIIGYLLAGIFIGPHVLGFIDHPEAILQFSELGIVLLLFVIGLELSPKRLIKMRNAVFGVGGAQVLLTGALITSIAWALGVGLAGSLVIGGALALSSTAFALQMLDEKRLLGSAPGQSAFGVLLFQDIIVIPYLALMPLLASRSSAMDDGVPLWLMLLGPVAVVAISRFALNPLLGFFAALRVQDAFVALILLLAIGFALLFESLGYSMGLGAFAAGILLAESSFRHQVEATVEPFKGLLLGLFFVAVGMGIPLQLLVERFGTLVLIVGLLLVAKSLVLLLIARIAGLKLQDRWYFALALAQGGEFGFVLFAQARGLDILSGELVEMLTAAIAVSMIVSQVLFSLYFRRDHRAASDQPYTPLESVEGSGRVIIAGFGRFGQIVGRVLSTQHIHYTAIDKDPKHLNFMRRFGNKVYYGDATDIELLQHAGIREAELLVLALDDIQESLVALQNIREICPDLPVIARAHNRMHAYQLTNLGAKIVVRETFDSSLRSAQKVLERLGFPDSSAADIVRIFRDHDEASVQENAALVGDQEALIQKAVQSREELQAIFDSDTRHSS